MNVSFVHSGWGGDRVTGGGGGPIDHRLERDVFPYRPTVVTVMLGMNDASYRKFEQPIFDVYTRGYQHLVHSLKKNVPGVRMTLIVPSPFDDVTRRPTFEGGYNQVLIRYGEFVRSLAQKEGAAIADLNTPVVAALKKANEIDPTHAQDLIRDRVHPGPAGQLLMAEALLEAWNAPSVVSTVEIDAGKKEVARAEKARVDDLEAGEKVRWTQLDDALPMPIDLNDPIIALAVKSSDVEEALNWQVLKVKGLEAPRYRLTIDGGPVGAFTKEQLSTGVNLARSMTPMLRQAMDVHRLTLHHNDLHFMRWRAFQVPLEKREDPVVAEAMRGLDGVEASLVADQRATAQPRPHRFELSPSTSEGR
jgi:lysophospholipase L1-like esterase